MKKKPRPEHVKAIMDEVNRIDEIVLTQNGLPDKLSTSWNRLKSNLKNLLNDGSATKKINKG